MVILNFLQQGVNGGERLTNVSSILVTIFFDNYSLLKCFLVDQMRSVLLAVTLTTGAASTPLSMAIAFLETLTNHPMGFKMSILWFLH